MAELASPIWVAYPPLQLQAADQVERLEQQVLLIEKEPQTLSSD